MGSAESPAAGAELFTRRVGESGVHGTVAEAHLSAII